MTEVSTISVLTLAANGHARLLQVTPYQAVTLFCFYPVASGLSVSLQVALKVGMSCQGCVGAVERVLKKMPGTNGSVPCIQGSQVPFRRLSFVHTFVIRMHLLQVLSQ